MLLVLQSRYTDAILSMGFCFYILISENNPDIFMLQEHWLTPMNLCLFEKYFGSYFAFGSSVLLSDSYISASASSAGAAAEIAASRKQVKYAVLSGSNVFQASSRLLWKLWAQSTNRLCSS